MSQTGVKGVGSRRHAAKNGGVATAVSYATPHGEARKPVVMQFAA